MLDMAQRRFYQGLWRRLAVLLLQVFFQRTGIDADADRDAPITRSIDHGTDTVFTTDIARVDTQTVNAQLGHTQGNAVIEVDIGDQRHLDQLLDTAKGFGSVHVRHRNTHDVDTRGFQTIDLCHGSGHIVGVAVGHALHRDRRITTDRYGTDPYFSGFATLDWRFAVHDLLP